MTKRYLRSSFMVALIPVLIIIPQTTAGEPDEDPRLEAILKRLEAAEAEVASLRVELNKMKKQGRSRKTTAKLIFPRQVVQGGKASLEKNCTQCHDASRALEKRKNFAEWQKVVARMARKRTANIPEDDLESIAAYLTSLNEPEEGLEDDTLSNANEETPALLKGRQEPLLGGQLDLDVTLSTVFRDSTGHGRELENGGFFPDIWFGGEWHSDRSPVRLRVQACVTCHTEGSVGNRVELVEAVAIFDLMFGKDAEGKKAELQAGRFIVPFGGFAEKSHPGRFRMVTRPLMFNMGQNVSRDDIGSAVLPMPYSDEGVMTNFLLPLNDQVNVSLDAYLVNGLQGNTSGIDFIQSRDYTDNNSQPAYGGRVTIGTSNIRLGGSYMAGQFNETEGSGILGRRLNYDLVGIDLTVRYRDLVRLQAEFARRNSDRIIFPQTAVKDEEIQGFDFEGEVRIHDKPRVSMVGRYDRIEHKGDLPPPGSSLTDSEFNVDRITWGFNVALPGGSMLLINHEHWIMPDELNDIDVIGGRWVVPF